MADNPDEEDILEIDQDSDHPVHERFVKEKHLKKIKEQRKKPFEPRQ